MKIIFFARPDPDFRYLLKVASLYKFPRKNPSHKSKSSFPLLVLLVFDTFHIKKYTRDHLKDKMACKKPLF